MQNCEKYQDLISALLDEEITDSERRDLMDHVALCSECRAYLDDQLALRAALQDLTAAAPAGFADGVMARVRETAQDGAQKESRKVIPFPALRRWAGLAACCAVVVLGVFALGGLPNFTNTGTNCAAPEAISDNYAAYSYGLADAADDGQVCLDDGSVPHTARSETSEAFTEESPCTAPCDDISANYAALICCCSDTAARWVRETLGEEWVIGMSYSLTAEQYDTLYHLLREENDAFTVLSGTEGSDVYLLLAQ